MDARRPLRRCAPPRPHARATSSHRIRSSRSARADGIPSLSHRRPPRTARRSRVTAGSGSLVVGRRPDSARNGRARPRPKTWRRRRQLCLAGRAPPLSHARPHRRSDRLEPDRAALRRADANPPFAHRGPESRRRRWHGPRPGRRTRSTRRHRKTRRRLRHRLGLSRLPPPPHVRGDLLLKLGRFTGARKEIERALTLTQKLRERELLAERLKQIEKKVAWSA